MECRNLSRQFNLQTLRQRREIWELTKSEYFAENCLRDIMRGLMKTKIALEEFDVVLERCRDKIYNCEITSHDADVLDVDESEAKKLFMKKYDELFSYKQHPVIDEEVNQLVVYNEKGRSKRKRNDG